MNAPRGQSVIKPPAQTAQAQTLSLVPMWSEVSINLIFALPPWDEQVVMVGASPGEVRLLQEHLPRSRALTVSFDAPIESIVEELRAQGPIDHIMWFAADAPRERSDVEFDLDLIAAQQRGVLSCFRLIKALLQAGYATRSLAFTAITRQAQAIDDLDRIRPAHASVHGLLGSMAKEYPHWKVRMADVEEDGPCPLEAILRIPADPLGDVWVHRHGSWYRRELLPYELSSLAPPTYREGGVYVVIGGAGGIGGVWTEHVIRTHQAQVIWIGRRQADAPIEARRGQLARFGPTPEYMQVDARDGAALQRAHEQIGRRYGVINGIVQAAIVLQDSSLATMSEERFKTALCAKVDASVQMMQVFGAEPLDFIAFFSSLQTFGKAPGQSNYVAGCAFEDAFAQHLARSRPGVVKVINWGYWGSVGIVSAPAYRARMARLGLGSIEPAEGMQAFDVLLGGPLRQMAFLKTTSAAAKQALPIATQEQIECYAPRLPDLSAQIDAAGKVRRALPSDVEYAVQGPKQQLDELLCRLLGEQLRSLGLLTHAHPFTTSRKQRMELLPQYERWLDESLRILLVQGYLTRKGAVVRTVAASPREPSELWAQWAQYRREQQGESSLAAQLDLVDRMLRSLGEILSGRRWAVEILFPRGSIEGMEQAYKNSSLVDYFNAVLADTLRAYVEARLQRERNPVIRVLEIGAGTGTTTSAMLATLAPYRPYIREYCYTDISPAFLRHGQQRHAAEFPFLTFRSFDVERAPSEQSIEAGGYDVVIAANVLHATKNIRRTLRNAKAVLGRYGVLLLSEIAANSMVAHLTFGLTPGWWLSEDTPVRLPGCPGLSASMWRRVLREEGFRSIGFPAEFAHTAGMQIIVAQSDGVVRQTRQTNNRAAEGVI